MRVEVRLFATLQRFLPPDGRDGAAVLDLPDGSTVSDVLTRLGIPPDMPWVALLNGEDAPGERSLAPGDQLTLFPPLAGGQAAPSLASSTCLPAVAAVGRPAAISISESISAPISSTTPLT